jgi:MFS family permease
MSVAEETAPVAVVKPLDATDARAPGIRRPRVRHLPAMAAFVGVSLALLGMYLAAGAPTPLFLLLEEHWGFPPVVLTIAFATYAFALLATLLVGGSLSDHIGRRPVLITALIIELASMVMFIVAPNIGVIIAARAVQGIATGLATSAFTAAIVELAPQRLKKLGAAMGSIAPTAGLAVGALMSGFAIQFTLAPAAVVFGILAAVMVVGTLVVVFAPETNPGRAGAVRSLIPRVVIPAIARREFAAGIPVHIAAWMLAGLFLGLGPTILRGVFDLDSGLVNGAATFLQPAAAAVAGLALGRLASRRATVLGLVGVLVGSVIIVIAIAAGILPLLFVGGAIGGFGFGAAFSGAIRSVAPLAGPHERAELFAAVYLVAYLAFGLPAVIAGLLIGEIGLLTTALAYGVAILVAAVVGIVAQLRLARQPA